MRLEWIAVAISAIALAVSSYTAYRQFYPFDELSVFSSYAHLEMSEGKFGRGPSLTAAVAIMNSGNRPVVLSTMSASFGYGDDINKPPTGCNTNLEGYWASTPWDYRIEKDDKSIALPSVIAPRSATSSVYVFVANPSKPSLDITSISLMVCLSYEFFDSDGEVHVARSPVGVVSYENGLITNITFHDKRKNIIKIIQQQRFDY